MLQDSEIWLSLDTSSAFGSFSFHRWRDNALTLMGEEEIGPQQSQSERLISRLRESLDQHRLKIADMDRFISTEGPGSFTGLRIAIATLKAFAYLEKKPIETVSGSEARALAWRMRNPDPFTPLVAITRVALQRFVRWTESEEIVTEVLGECEEGTVVLVDELSAKLSFPPSLRRELFPLRARYLAEGLFYAKSRRTYRTLGEWIVLSPEYLGATRFKTKAIEF
jgi:tRNA threonylcarbamoyl adenosine modification protein YeaZ